MLLREFNDRIEEKDARLEKMEQELEAKSGLENVVERLKRRLNFVENEQEITSKKKIHNIEEFKHSSTREILRFHKEQGAKKVEENIFVKEFEQNNLSREDSSRDGEITDWKQTFGMKTGFMNGKIEGRKNELDEQALHDITGQLQRTYCSVHNSTVQYFTIH